MAQFVTPATRTTSKPTIHKPGPQVTVFVEERQRHLMEAFVVGIHHLKEIAEMLAGVTFQNLDSPHRSNISESWMPQDASEKVKPSRVSIMHSDDSEGRFAVI